MPRWICVLAVAGCAGSNASPTDAAKGHLAPTDAPSPSDGPTDGPPADAPPLPPGWPDAATPDARTCSTDTSGAAVEMVAVPAGPFMMGCDSAVDTGCGSDENPYHQVTLSAFRIDKTEVTQRAYKACYDACACTWPAELFNPDMQPNYPVVGVTWAQARQFCTWLGKRLPTEAEWEKAARGTDGRVYPWGNQAPDCTRASFLGCGNGLPQAVGSFSPAGDSPYGAQDMAGNVWELVADHYDPSYYAQSPAMDPQGTMDPAYVDVIWRGGGGIYGAGYLRTSARFPYDPSIYYSALGFRCAQSGP